MTKFNDPTRLCLADLAHYLQHWRGRQEKDGPSASFRFSHYQADDRTLAGAIYASNDSESSFDSDSDTDMSSTIELPPVAPAPPPPPPPPRRPAPGPKAPPAQSYHSQLGSPAPQQSDISSPAPGRTHQVGAPSQAPPLLPPKSLVPLPPATSTLAPRSAPRIMDSSSSQLATLRPPKPRPIGRSLEDTGDAARPPAAAHTSRGASQNDDAASVPSVSTLTGRKRPRISEDDSGADVAVPVKRPKPVKPRRLAVSQRQVSHGSTSQAVSGTLLRRTTRQRKARREPDNVASGYGARR